MSLHYHVNASWVNVSRGSSGMASPGQEESTSGVIGLITRYMRQFIRHRNSDQFGFTVTVCDGSLCRPQSLGEPSIDSDA